MGSFSSAGDEQERRRPPRRRRLRRLALVAAAIATAWLAVVVGVRLAFDDRVLPGTKVGGLSLGGRSSDAARRLLASAFAPRRSVTLTGGERRFTVSAAQAGYRVDVPASVTRARSAGREGPLNGLWSTIASLPTPRKLEPVARVDRGRLATQIDAIAQAIDRPGSAGALITDVNADGVQVRARAPSTGRSLDRAATAATVVAALHDRRPGPVPLAVRTHPTVTRDEVQAVASRARDYLRIPVQLTAGGRTVTLTTRQTAAILALERARGPGSGELRLGVDAGRVTRLVSALARDLDRASADARISAPRGRR